MSAFVLLHFFSFLSSQLNDTVMDLLDTLKMLNIWRVAMLVRKTWLFCDVLFITLLPSS